MSKNNQRNPGKYGPWTIKATQTVYEDPFVEVQVDQVVRPDSCDGQHVVVWMKPGVCVLPLDDEKNIYLTREFHYGIGRQSLEGVSGGIEPGEDPRITAERELAEELGLAATNWERLGAVDPFTTIVVSPTQLFLATGLSKVPSSPEGTEQIESVKMPLSRAISMVVDGTITHAPTCVLLFLASAHLN